MKKRQIIIIIVAIAILVVGKLLSNVIATPKEKVSKKPSKNITTVFTEAVQNDSVAIFVQSTGVLEATKRLEIYAEVQGQMMPDNGRFKAGNSFKKGELLVSIRSNDQQAQLFSQRSSFESALTAVMADLKIDYPEEFPKWEAYLQSYSSDKAVPKLPETKSEKLNAFLVGRGIYSNYHSLKNTEIINGKYNIRAPYDGVLISANADPGTVIRQGQALGVFIQPLKYEMETSIDAVSAERLEIGQKVNLTMEGLADKKWEGTITRLVKAVDQSSQMSTFFVTVNGKDLKEGMYLQAEVEATKIPNSFEISRSALIEGNKVYVVQADTLSLKNIHVEYFNQNTAIVTGLKNRDQVLVKVPPSAFEGMQVAIYKEDK